MLTRTLFALTLTLAPLAAVHAQPARQAAAQARSQASVVTERERRHAEMVQQALAPLAQAGSITRLPPSSLVALRSVLDQAPASFPRVEARGKVTIIRAQDMGEMLLTTMTLPRLGMPTATEQAFNTYPMAALILGSNATATGRPADALVFLDKGLALQPEDAGLTTEKAAALAKLGRQAEALALIDGYLALNPLAGLTHRGRILRSKGFFLIELNRLPDAKAAYEESLTIDKDNATAKAQLTYIAQLQAGGPRRGVEVLTGADAAEQRR